MAGESDNGCMLTQDDGVWMTSTSFTIFTMTAGFGLLECGRVASKDEVNVMIKNVVDVIFGGLAYWMFGYGLTFGSSEGSNSYVGFGDFFFDPERNKDESETEGGISYALFIFQMSFATTTSTIVSAGMTERIFLASHCFVTFFITIIHSVVGHWVWSPSGVFHQMGVVDSAGCSAVHLVGGIGGLVATLYLKPRHNRFTKNAHKTISDPTKSILGFLMIWWGWLAFNTASNYAVTQNQWAEGMRSAVVTIMASAGGGFVTLTMTKLMSKKLELDMIIDGLLASLVSSTAGCLYFTPLQATVVGSIGSFLGLLIIPLIERLHIDDPVGVVPVHVVGSIWGMLSPGFFINRPVKDATARNCKMSTVPQLNGLIYGGGFHLLSLQVFATTIIIVYTSLTAFVILYTLQHSPLGLRISKYDEEVGADLREHGLSGMNLMTYTVEKKMDAKSLSVVLMYIVRWRIKTRLGVLRRKKIRDLALAAKKTPTNGAVNGVINGEPRRRVAFREETEMKEMTRRTTPRTPRSMVQTV